MQGMRLAPEVGVLLSKVPYLDSKVATSWEAVRQMRFDPERELKHRAADQLAREFAAKVLKRNLFELRYEPEGRVTRVRAYCLTFEELADLLTDAYAAGRKDAVCVSPAFVAEGVTP